jgi:hypothetical protein
MLPSNILIKKHGGSKDGLKGTAPLRKNLSFFLFLLFALFTLGGAFHHHADGFEHDGCLLCGLASQHSEYFPLAPFFISPEFLCLPYSFSEGSFVLSSIVQDSSLSRAPPAFALSL